MVAKFTPNNTPSQDMANVLRGWIMIALTLTFVGYAHDYLFDHDLAEGRGDEAGQNGDGEFAHHLAPWVPGPGRCLSSAQSATWG